MDSYPRKYLIELREKNKMSQQNVADKLNLSRQYYCGIENGNRQKKMDITLISALAMVFGLTLGEIADFEKQWSAELSN